MFFVIIAMLAWAVSTAQTGILLKEEYGKHSGEELIDILLSDEEDPNSPYTTVDGKSLQLIYDDHFKRLYPGETLGNILNGTKLVSAGSNFVQTHQIGYVNDDAGFAWGGRRSGEPYPGEKLLVYKGIAWASAYCWNPVCPKVLPRTSLTSTPQKRQRKASYTPPSIMEEHEEEVQEEIVYADYREPRRPIRKPVYREEVQYVQTERQRNPWNKNLNVNLDPGTIMMGIASLKVAWDGLKTRSISHVYNHNQPRRYYPPYRQYPGGNGWQGGTSNASGGQFQPGWYDNGGQRVPQTYSNTWNTNGSNSNSGNSSGNYGNTWGGANYGSSGINTIGVTSGGIGTRGVFN